MKNNNHDEHPIKKFAETTEMSDKFFRTCRDYEMAYRSGCKGTEVETAVKIINHTVEYLILIAKVTEYVLALATYIRLIINMVWYYNTLH